MIAITQKYRRLFYFINIKKCVRNKTSLGLWHEDLNSSIKLEIEKHWASESINDHKIKTQSKTCFILPMFPYPSGNLHMGHVRVYTISDTVARFHKLNGFKVIHPMGWDAFGLPAENAAIERNIPPHRWTFSNINTMKEQLMKLCFNFDWDAEISTCDPNYYKWTQYIFIKLFEKGLAYQSKALVNWDPIDKTVLADEQVDELGCSWRSGAKVIKKPLTQWFIKTTKFAKQLYDGLNNNNLENWRDIINLQKHWIGECDGVVVTFTMDLGDGNKPFDVWSKDPYKFLHGQFLLMSKSNAFIQELTPEKCDHLKAINPLTGLEMPIYITDKVEYPEGKDVYIACPNYNSADKQLAVLLNVSHDINKENHNIDIELENQRAIEIAEKKNIGGYYVSSKLKDWLISRQRYWGTPIPIIHCSHCGTVPVPYDELPVELPLNSDVQKLKDEWINCNCPKCQRAAKRETDTMDTFVDSSWYYYRFLDPKNTEIPFDRQKLVSSTPVDLYIGGKEHAVLHLYYARFMSYFLHSIGWTPTQEPFKKLLVQGMVMGESYKVKSSGRYITKDNVEKIGEMYREKSTGELVCVQWEKMSKSKHNGENPERLLNTYGCDTTRLLILADVPPATSRHWSEATFPGVLNWQNRLWMTIRSFIKIRNEHISSGTITEEEFKKHEAKIWQSRNYFTATTTYHYRHTQQLSVGISRLQGLTSTLRNNLPPEIIAKSQEFELALGALIIMLAPAAPHFCSELWAGFVSAKNRLCTRSQLIIWNVDVHQQNWPKVDDHFPLSFLCKVDGADRYELKIKSSDLENLSQEEALELMMKQNKVANRLKKGISKVKYDLYPGCRSILHIYSNRDLQKAKVHIENV